MQKRLGNITRADLELRVAAARLEALYAKQYGCAAALIVAILLGSATSWFLSVPLAIGGYILLNKTKKKALAKAWVDLMVYDPANPHMVDT